MDLPTIDVKIGSQALQVEVAVKLKDKIRGLQQHTSLPPDHGMLFVFSPPEMLRVWMQDTALPLSLAFLDETAQIVYLSDLEPFSETVHTWPTPLPFFLETNQGWFAQHAIEIGMTVSIPEQAKWLKQAAPRPMGFRLRR